MPNTRLSSAAAIALAIAAGPSAMAQSLLPGAPAPAAAPSGIVQSTILATRPLARAEAAAQPQPRLTAFEQAKSAFRLEGEADVAHFSFVLDSGTLAGGGDLVLAYRNAVSVMPETSIVSVMVNGTTVGEFPIRSPLGFAQQAFAVSPAFLKVGVNEVRLRAVQRHRVDCSLEATYELWTELDPAASGFRPAKARAIADFAGLRTLGRDDRDLTDLRLILPDGARPEAINRAMPLVQTMALALNRDDLSVTVANTPGPGPGIDLVAIADDEQGSAKAAAGNAPHGLSVVAGADPERPTVVLRAATQRDMPGILLGAIEGPLKPLFDTGIRASRLGEIRAKASSAYTLADAGYQTAPFSGRLFRTRFELVLPSDFYPAEYATLDLALHAATSPGLKPTSQFLVRVNGNIVKSLPMRDADGEVFSGRRMELPLRAFRPGRNQIELLAELERAADDACVFAERDDSAPRFILLDTTEIRVPALARVARLPELAAMAGSGYPYASVSGLRVHTLKPDANSISAALTLVAKLGMAAAAPIPAELAFGPPEANSDENTLVIAPKRALEDYSRLGAAAFPAAAQEIDFALDLLAADPIQTSSIHLPGAALPMTMVTDPVALLDAFRKTVRDRGGEPATLTGLSNRLEEALSGFRRWLNYERPSGSGLAVEPRRKAMLWQSPSVSGHAVVTWLTADSPLDMLDASAMLADPAVWNRLEGESVTLDLDAGGLRTTRPAEYFAHDLRDFSLGNLRRITAAWFSDNFRIYVGLVIVLMAVFAIWVGRIVPKAGVRTDQ